MLETLKLQVVDLSVADCLDLIRFSLAVMKTKHHVNDNRVLMARKLLCDFELFPMFPDPSFADLTAKASDHV